MRRHKKSVAVFGTLYATRLSAETRRATLPKQATHQLTASHAPAHSKPRIDTPDRRRKADQPLTRSARARAVAESGPGWPTKTAAR
jgi:hypothetical protein